MDEKTSRNVLNQVNRLVMWKELDKRKKKFAPRLLGMPSCFWSNAQGKSKWNSTNFQHSKEKRENFYLSIIIIHSSKSHNENWKKEVSQKRQEPHHRHSLLRFLSPTSFSPLQVIRNKLVRECLSISYQ